MPKEIKRFVKSQLNKLAIALFVYELIFQLGAAVLMFHGTGVFQNEYFAMILCSSLALLSTYMILGSPRPLPEDDRTGFNLFIYLYLLAIFYGMQFLAMLINHPVEVLLNELGFSLSAASEAASGGDITNPLMIFYTVLFAPLFEELLFRFFLYNELRAFGKNFAIFSAALLFALMHGNILQFVVALTLGLLLGIIRERFGLRYAILLHLSNNALAILFNNYNDKLPQVSALYLTLLLSGLVSLSVSAVLLFRRWRASLQAEKSFPYMISCFFSSSGILILILAFLGLAAANLN